MPHPHYYLGCPIWACEDWVGSIFTSRSRQSWLAEYSAAFNTVEGNSTFYGLPASDVVQRWADQTAEGFRFCLKFPSTITHERQLVDAEAETAEFLDRLAILHRAGRLGPSMLQLPPFFAGRQLPQLEKFLNALPDEFPYAVEVRHLDYFDRGSCENQLNHLLYSLGMDRALFDTRALFSKPASDPLERKSQDRKPQSPHRATVTGQRPMLRFVGRNDHGEASQWIEEWVAVVAKWIRQGLSPFVFTHSPDDKFSPLFAAEFHVRLSQHLPSLQPLPAWPGTKIDKQQSLF